MTFATRPLEKADCKSVFSCGVDSLDSYFRQFAWKNHESGISCAYVLPNEQGADPRVRGYYTLSMANVEAEALAGVLLQKLPRYPLPVALIGRLAVDNRARGQRCGEILLIDAMRRVHDIATSIGCVGVIVDARDQHVVNFYAKYDFVPIEPEAWPDPLRMFIPITTMRSAAE